MQLSCLWPGAADGCEAVWTAARYSYRNRHYSEALESKVGNKFVKIFCTNSGCACFVDRIRSTNLILFGVYVSAHALDQIQHKR